MSTLSRVVYSPDTTPPTTPTSVTATALSQTAIRITWAASTDTGGSGLAGYRVYRSTTSTGTYSQIGSDLTTSSLSYDDTSLGASTTRYYRIAAFDGNANTSSQSATANATTQSAPSSGEWADVYGDHTGIEAGIAVDGQRYGIRASALSGWHPQYLVGTSVIDYVAGGAVGNGATFARIDNGSFDALEPAIEIRPPTIFQGANPGDAKILASHLYRGGLNDNAQINIRVLAFFAPRYWDLAAETKLDGLLCAPNVNQPGAAATGRAAVFTQHNPPTNGYQYPCVTSGTVQTYNYPPEGFSSDSGAQSTKLCRIGPSPDHSFLGPQIGGEWVCLEHVVDARQDRGNANGMNKLYLWTRDRVANGRFLRIDLTWGPWSFANRFIQTYEGLGFYFNNASTAHVDNYVRYSHWTIARNMGINEVIGPPIGF